METAQTPIQAVLFDFDGTLVDSEYLHHESWLEAVAPWGVTLSWEEYERQLVGISDRRACEFFLRLAGRAVTAEAIREGRAGKHRSYRARSIRELRIGGRVRKWIHRHHGRVPMGVVSSSAIPDVVPILEQQGVAGSMEFIICGDHVDRLKPDPMPYLLAREKLTASFEIESGQACLVFEDSLTGVQAARSAGMMVHVLEGPQDLPRALEAWEGRLARVRG